MISEMSIAVLAESHKTTPERIQELADKHNVPQKIDGNFEHDGVLWFVEPMRSTEIQNLKHPSRIALFSACIKASFFV